VEGRLTQTHRDQLAGCYRACLKLAEEYQVGSIAFCCISTGVFRFPNDAAADIAVSTVKQYKAETGSRLKVIFNVFKEADQQLYAARL
jgi:O-acetyl-ADP-ribose deacetylase (regulator of RNase III)